MSLRTASKRTTHRESTEPHPAPRAAFNDVKQLKLYRQRKDRLKNAVPQPRPIRIKASSLQINYVEKGPLVYPAPIPTAKMQTTTASKKPKKFRFAESSSFKSLLVI